MTPDWLPVSTMPPHKWCRTKREGEDGENQSLWCQAPGGEREYWDRDGYSTIINPGSFAPPTHWKPL